MSRENPFHGMNPYLESRWADVHGSLVYGIRDALGESLPESLHARAEEEILIESADIGGNAVRRTDARVEESWQMGIAPTWVPGGGGPATEGTVMAAEPDVVVVAPEPAFDRWVQITGRDGRLVTVIEVLSSSNKQWHREQYLRRQADFLKTSANLVEIDLLRGGQHTVAVRPDLLLQAPAGTHYLACVRRAARPELREVYYLPPRERLPAIKIPLRAEDEDVVLDLQPLIERAYRLGRYWQTDYHLPPSPPLPPEDAEWARERLRAACLLPALS